MENVKVFFFVNLPKLFPTEIAASGDFSRTLLLQFTLLLLLQADL